MVTLIFVLSDVARQHFSDLRQGTACRFRKDRFELPTSERMTKITHLGCHIALGADCIEDRARFFAARNHSRGAIILIWHVVGKVNL